MAAAAAYLSTVFWLSILFRQIDGYPIHSASRDRDALGSLAELGMTEGNFVGTDRDFDVRERCLPGRGAVDQHVGPRLGVHVQSGLRRRHVQGGDGTRRDVDCPLLLVSKGPVAQHETVAACREHHLLRSARRDRLVALDHFDGKR